MNQDINSIINQLAEIDSASAKIMQQTQNEKTKYAEYINQQKQQYDEKLQKEIDISVLECQKQMDEKSQLEIEKCKSDCNKEIKQLENIFKDKGSEWADHIFNNIIKE